MQFNRGKSLVRSAAVLSIVAAGGYVMGAVMHNTFGTPNASTAFAQSVTAAEPFARTLPADDDYAPSPFDWARSSDQFIEAPRECDATHGPTTACIFMD
jgi:hypothetical protein